MAMVLGTHKRKTHGKLTMAAPAAVAAVLHRVAAVYGATAVGLGAWGAHGFKPKDPYYAEVFRRANHYQLLHSLLLAYAPHTR